MQLINLKLIDELRLVALSLKHIARDSCYNNKGHELDNGLFVGYMKAYFQAYNLAKQLEALRSICWYYASGRIAFRSAECDSNGELLDKNVGTEPDGFTTLFSSFAGERPDDLPAHIEQYSELLILATNFLNNQAQMRTLLKEYAPNKTFVGVDTEGEPVLKPDPVDLTARHKMDTAVQSCLDNYNTFFGSG